jgi:UDP:flavonoid glycosyltransferase YjiC (YdhE family)
MRIVCSSRGSRGDVLPVLHIAAALSREGHEVTTCAPPVFRSTVERLGLEGIYYSEDSVDVMRSFGAGWKAARYALEWLNRSVDEQLELLLPLSREADALVTTVNEAAGPAVGEYRDIPHFRVTYAPTIPGDQPPPLQPFQRLPASANRVLWLALNSAVQLLFYRKVGSFRRRLGLRPVRSIADYLGGGSPGSRTHTLLAFSPSLAPPARGWRYPHTYLGYCFEDNEKSGDDRPLLAPALERFLEAGPPPVYVGFGSVSITNPARLFHMLQAAISQLGCRAVIGQGWTGLGKRPPGAPRAGTSTTGRIFVAGETCHAALFSKVAAVGHHGGSGTLHTAARAGVPQLVMPQMADQYYWGERVRRLGVGPAPLPPYKLTAERLAESFDAMLRRPRMSGRARWLARRISTERGLRKAVQVITGSVRS